MAAYTIEDIELIRRESGISYQEAVSLLDYHNGNVARALIDLERSGKLKYEYTTTDRTRTTSQTNTSSKTTAAGRTSAADRASAASSTSAASISSASSEFYSNQKRGIMHYLDRLYRIRIKVTRKGAVILNVSVLFAIISALFSLPLLICSIVCILLLGYHVSVDKSDPDFAGENVDRTVKNTAQNFKPAFDEFTKGFQDSTSNAKGEKQAENDFAHSYYTSKPVHHSCPTINVPVQVKSKDGRVTIEDDTDGFNSATIK